MSIELIGEDIRVYHYRDGLCFYRTDSGDVRGERDGTLVAVITADSWVSAVAAMSKGGENAASYAAAHKLHIGG